MRRARQALSPSDRRLVTAISHAATRPESSIEHYQALRMAHPRRALATWWLLEADDKAVASLICHPLRIATENGPVDGYGLGAMATRPEARRRGNAAALCEAAIAFSEAQGRSAGLLFSAIPPAYYERMGFRPLVAWQYTCERLTELAESGESLALLPLDPRHEVEQLTALYAAHHASSLHLHRDAAGFLRTIQLAPIDLYFGLGDPLQGYVRAEVDGTLLDILELIAPPALRAPTLRALAHLAAAVACTSLRGWFPPIAELAPWLKDEPRTKTLPMIRGVAKVSHSQFWPSDYF